MRVQERSTPASHPIDAESAAGLCSIQQLLIGGLDKLLAVLTLQGPNAEVIAGHAVEVELSWPGTMRAPARRDWNQRGWTRRTIRSWRLMPLVLDNLGGLLIHPLDLAINLNAVGSRSTRSITNQPQRPGSSGNNDQR